MPTPRHRYTLLGFSDDLDWRALNFVDPIPPNIVCKACGLVTRVTAFLPCLHVFCKKCYEQCRDNDVHCCPLDGQRAAEEDVHWIEYPVQNLLKRKVKCWNEDRGCDIVLPASELNKHFCKDCDHHSISCPRCSMAVRCNNVCTHLQSECRDHVMSVASANPETNNTGENAIDDGFECKYRGTSR
ncbi:RING finger protein 151-like [Rhipicephalus sanguineus]|uniref:RING finger protein 151-like n=1 Tax=Rhipicephalus sanguineus TaxID=34632 RepID=UPI001894BBD4|nr:RING finger protein 151-like [Rhipicephalus sanguineus]